MISTLFSTLSLQKNHRSNANSEKLEGIFFISKELHDYELRYSPLEKQAFALVRVVSHFRPYILTIAIKAYFPHPLVKMMLSQPFQEGRWANWLEKLKEFDIEVRLLKAVKGQGLCKLIIRIDVVNLSP